jgi:hypothetical protein
VGIVLGVTVEEEMDITEVVNVGSSQEVLSSVNTPDSASRVEEACIRVGSSWLEGRRFGMEGTWLEDIERDSEHILEVHEEHT